MWEYSYMVHMYLYAYVYVLKKQASGFSHMQNVITLFFLGYVCGQEMDLAKKWTIYSSFKSTNGLKRKINIWKQETHLEL